MSDVVLLSMAELNHAAHVGSMRNLTAIRDGRRLESGRGDAGWERHITGAVGEMALHKLCAAYWNPAIGVLDTLLGDGPGGVQLRSTTRPGGSLIVKPEDPDALFALAVIVYGARETSVTFPGVMRTAEAQQAEWWRSEGNGVHRGAWFVPQAALNPIGSLVA